MHFTLTFVEDVVHSGVAAYLRMDVEPVLVQCGDVFVHLAFP